jgi:hypothetical protein
MPISKISQRVSVEPLPSSLEWDYEHPRISIASQSLASLTPFERNADKAKAQSLLRTFAALADLQTSLSRQPSVSQSRLEDLIGQLRLS